MGNGREKDGGRRGANVGGLLSSMSNHLFHAEFFYSENSFTRFVSNILEEMSKTELEAMFCRIGKVLNSFIPMDKLPGKKRGFAFVRFGSFQEAEKVVELASGRSWGGRKYQVHLSKSKHGVTDSQIYGKYIKSDGFPLLTSKQFWKVPPEFCAHGVYQRIDSGYQMIEQPGSIYL